jgi:hypothetical protein
VRKALPRPGAAAYNANVLRWILALGLAGPIPVVRAASEPAGDTGPAASEEPSTPSPGREGERGTLVLGPGGVGTVRVVDAEGVTVATVTPRAGQPIALELAPGSYRVQDFAGEEVTAIDLAANGRVEVEIPKPAGREALPVVVPTAESQASPEPSVADADASTQAEPAKPTEAVPEPPKRDKWKRWATPLFSALVPGVGQMVNREYGKGVGILLSTVSLGLAAFAVSASGDPTEGATPGDEGASKPEEVITLGAYAGLTGALALLYAGQIMDARAVAVGEPVRPRTEHKVGIDLVRMSTVGMRPNEPAYTLYRDWAVSVMGQVARRLSVGISDISIMGWGTRAGVTVQSGLRVKYRFFDRKRLWLAAAVGNLFQGTAAEKQPDVLDPDDDSQETEGAFGAIPYVQLEGRLFLLDRWSLNLIPRFSVPLTTRYFTGDRAIPRYAPTFELGTGVGVYF